MSQAMYDLKAHRQRKSQQVRSLGITVLNSASQKGYNVCDKVTGQQYAFTSNSSSMDELLADAEECLEHGKKAAIDGGTPPALRQGAVAKRDPTLPMYVAHDAVMSASSRAIWQPSSLTATTECPL